MIVVQQHCGGNFTPIYYPRKSIKVYLGQQARTFHTLPGIEEVHIDYDTQFEFQIPFRTRILKYLRNEFECIVNKEQKYTLMLIPSIAIRFTYSEDTLNELIEDPFSVVWKDLLYFKPKVEKDMLSLLERVSLKTGEAPSPKNKKKKSSSKKRKYKPKKKYYRKKK